MSVIHFAELRPGRGRKTRLHRIRWCQRHRCRPKLWRPSGAFREPPAHSARSPIERRCLRRDPARTGVGSMTSLVPPHTCLKCSPPPRGSGSTAQPLHAWPKPAERSPKPDQLQTNETRIGRTPSLTRVKAIPTLDEPAQAWSQTQPNFGRTQLILGRSHGSVGRTHSSCCPTPFQVLSKPTWCWSAPRLWSNPPAMCR